MPNVAFTTLWHISPLLSLLWLLDSLVIGACVGSFINVVWDRLGFEVRKGSVLKILSAKNRCPKCNFPIRWRDNLPLLSWMLLRGRCRVCHWRIPLRYWLAEFVTGVLTMLASILAGLTWHTVLIWSGGACGVALIGVWFIRRSRRRAARARKEAEPPVNTPPPSAHVPNTFTVPFFNYTEHFGWRVAHIRVEPEMRPDGADVYRLIPVLIGIQEVCPGGVVHIPDTPYELVENGRILYGPFHSPKEALNQMRPYMMHASARSLYQAMEKCGIQMAVLRARLHDNAVNAANGQYSHSVALAAWLDLVSAKLGDQPGVIEVRRALIELRMIMLRYGPAKTTNKSRHRSNTEDDRLLNAQRRSVGA